MQRIAFVFNCFKLSTKFKTRLSHFYILSRPITTTPVPTHQQIAHLILDQKSATKALQTFRWASKLPNFTHSQSTYRALVNKLCTFRQFEVAKELLDEMPSSIGSPPDEDVFITLVRGLGRAHRIKEVIKVLELVSKFEKNPSLKLYNSILDVLVKEDIDIAREFYRKKMMRGGVQGDDYTYGILMKGLCLTNRIADGYKLLQLMKSRGLKPNIVVYNTLLHALCKNGKAGRARSLMSEIEEPNDVTFNIMISAYCADKKLAQALVILDKSLRNGFLPDIITVTKLMESLCNEGRVSEAVEIFERVEEKGGTFDAVAYNTLIKGFCGLGKVKVASKFIKEMEMKGCLPNADTYNSLIYGFCKSGMFDSALDMFDEMKTVGIEWNFTTFDTFIHGLSSGGKIEDSKKILKLMEENMGGSGGHISPYNSIIYGMYRENCLDEALDFLSKMETLFPRVVGRSLRIWKLCEDYNVEEAKIIYAKMIDEGDHPSTLVYTKMINAFCQRECITEALDLLGDMIGRGYLPIATTVNTLINGLCRRSKVRTALKLMEDMAEKGFSPDSGSYNPLIIALCSKGDLQTAVLSFLQMLERSITPDYESWNAVVVCLCQQKIWPGGNGEIQVSKQFQCILGT